MTLEVARQVRATRTILCTNRYKQGDPVVTGEVDKAFQQSFGSHEVEIDKINMGGNNHG